MSRSILGLDIRNDAVSAVLLNHSLKGNSIEAHIHVPVSGKDMEEGIRAALKIIVEKLDITHAVCIASFPSDRISFRNLSVPFKEQNKIRQMLPFELEPTLPFPIDDLLIDFMTVKLSDHTDLITAAVEKSAIQSYLETLASFHIDPEIVTPSGFSTVLSLVRLSDLSKNTLIVDIDNQKSTIFAIASGQISLVRSLPIETSVSPRAELLCANIQRTISAFEEMSGFNFKPDEIRVTGCGLNDLGLDQSMPRMLGIPVRRVDLLHDTGIPLKERPSSWEPVQMDNAFALALLKTEGIQGLNFRRGPFAAKQTWAEQKKSIIKTGVLAFLVLILAFFHIILDNHFMETKLNRLNHQMNDILRNAFPDVKKIVDPLQQMRIKIQDSNKFAVIPGEPDKNIRNIDILNHISRLIPDQTDVELTGIVIGKESAVISGTTDTFNSVDDMKNRLEQNEFFKKVTISSANIDRSGNRVNFKLKIDL